MSVDISSESIFSPRNLKQPPWSAAAIKTADQFQPCVVRSIQYRAVRIAPYHENTVAPHQPLGKRPALIGLIRVKRLNTSNSGTKTSRYWLPRARDQIGRASCRERV